MTPPEYRFAEGATVRVMASALRRNELPTWPDRATIVDLTEEDDALFYRVRQEGSNRDAIVASRDVFGVCGCAWPGYSGGCLALVHHGPGHQSHTHCRLKRPHEIHEAVYGEFRQLAYWRGEDVFSGFFDEPPEDPND